jgi:hypothetical protein
VFRWGAQEERSRQQLCVSHSSVKVRVSCRVLTMAGPAVAVVVVVVVASVPLAGSRPCGPLLPFPPLGSCICRVPPASISRGRLLATDLRLASAAPALPRLTRCAHWPTTSTSTSVILCCCKLWVGNLRSTIRDPVTLTPLAHAVRADQNDTTWSNSS